MQSQQIYCRKNHMNRLLLPSKYSHNMQAYLNNSIHRYHMLQVITPEISQVQAQKHNDIYGVYSAEILVKMVNLTQICFSFLPILGFDLIRNGHQMQINSILRPAPMVNLTDLKIQFNNTNELDYKMAIQNLLIVMVKSAETIILKNKIWINDFDLRCFEFYLYENNGILKIVLGFKDLKLVDDQQADTSKLLLQHVRDSIKELGQIKYKQSIYLDYLSNTQLDCIISKKRAQLNKQFSEQFEKIREKECIDPQIYCFNMYSKIMSNYTGHVFDLIHSSIVGITEMIFLQHLRQNKEFNRKFINTIDITINKPYQGQIYHNIKCAHFQGLSYQIYSNQNMCPLCGQDILFDKQRVNQVGRNIFQMLILHNSINCKQKSVIYYFRDKVFTFRDIITQNYLQKFQDYYHYQMYIKRTKNIHNRNEVVNYHSYETISLYNKIAGKKKYYNIHQLIKTPVRGKYCHHWQFYDLKRVYSQLLQKNSQYFQCFVCCQDVHSEQLIFLEEMQHLINLSAQYFPTNQSLNRYSIFINHQEKEVTLNYQSSLIKQASKLYVQVYETLCDPLKKSRYNQQYWTENKIKLAVEFSIFFFGK